MDLFINKCLFHPEKFNKKNDEITIGENLYKLIDRSEHRLIFAKNGKNLIAYYSFNALSDEYLISLEGRTYRVKLGRSGHVESSASSSNVIISPMPGKIFKVLKKVGDSVTVGETVLILDAMKMEHSLKANVDGVIKTLKGKIGDQVSADQLLVEIQEKQA